MIVIAEERFVESPYIEWVAHGYTIADGLTMRPTEYTWHLIFTRHEGVLRTLVVVHWKRPDRSVMWQVQRPYGYASRSGRFCPICLQQTPSIGR